ncbi:MAG: class I SAM-dependent methyltransferase [Cyanothece sp. SIO1E1]|nr:class I SAM-dependent methyltransferase [Cyanothece sp. SIO1E1]
MTTHDPDSLEKIRQQYNFGPYPRIPLDKSPKNDGNALYIHSLTTPYYLRNQRVIDTQGKLILDAGCGTGYKSLALAEANPGAKIVGVDISEESVKLAEQRLQHHDFDNAEFYALPLEDLSELGLEFDYINCDEVLYLLPDIAATLKVMKSVLKPNGIIRSNLHSSLQRFGYFRAQEMFKMMGLLNDNPEDLEIEIAVETMQALKDGVNLKSIVWKEAYAEADGKEGVLVNYLLQGDKGYTIPDLFSALNSAGLEFISMVNWRKWELMDLFKEPENLPTFLAMSLPEISVEERLHLFELLHPANRLLDFWCGHPEQAMAHILVDQWQDSEWATAQVTLNPHLRTDQVKQNLIECITNQQQFEISAGITLPTTAPINIDSSIASCLLPLWDGAQPVMSLVDRWRQVRPLHPATLEPVTPAAALNDITKLLSNLETYLYVLIQQVN